MPSAEHRYGSSTVAAQVTAIGTQDNGVLGLTAEASASRQPYIAVRVGRVLIYVHDYAALHSYRAAWERATELAPSVFGPEPDAFAQAAAAERRRIERQGRPSPSESG